MVPDATGTTSTSSFHFLCIREARPSQPAQLIDFLSAMIASSAHSSRAHVRARSARLWSCADACRCCWSLLPGWCSGHVPEHLQINARKARWPLGWAVKWTFREKRIEYILYPYLTTPTSCLHRNMWNMQGPSHPDPTLPCNIEETWSEGTAQCALKTAAKMPLKCMYN